MGVSIEAPPSWRAAVEHVGGMPVYRPLPHQAFSSVGPFVLLDHFGPVPSVAGKLPAHPHAGIEVMTYLISGTNEHRDSAGNVGRVSDGGAQWMRAGRGILHSEETLASTAPFHGLQIWARLSLNTENADPLYRAIQSEDVPVHNDDGVIVRVLAGSVEDCRGPIVTDIPSTMLHVSLTPGATFSFDGGHPGGDYGAYVIAGELSVSTMQSVRAQQADFTVWKAGDGAVIFQNSGATVAEVFILGGESPPQPLVFGGPFVYDNSEKLLSAEGRFRAGEMGTLDGVPF